MRKTRFGLKWLLPMLFVVTSCAALEAAQNKHGALSPSEVDAIRKVMQSYPKSWLSGNQVSILSHFWPDAVWMPHHGVEPIEGIDAIKKFWWPEGASPSGVLQYNIEPSEIYGSSELAFVRARFSLVYWYGEDTERQESSMEGNYLAILKRGQDENWRIFRAIWNDPVAEVVLAGDDATKAEIAEVVRAYFEAGKARNLRGVLDLLATGESLRVIPPFPGPSFEGYEPYKKHVEDRFRDESFVFLDYEITALDIQLSKSRDVAWGSAVVDERFELDGESHNWVGMNWTFVVELSLDGWTFSQIHFSPPDS